MFDAVESLLREHPEISGRFQVQIIGDGPRAPLLKAAVKSKKLEEHVFFVGEKWDYRIFLKPVDILILPSLDYEDFPFVVIEAMSMARPVIGTRVAGMPEQIDDGETGFLCDPGNAQALAAAMFWFLQNPDMVNEMGTKGLEKFNRLFKLENALKAYYEVYQETI